MPRYRQALASLAAQSKVYQCGCSRRMLPPNGLYPGTCRANALETIDDQVHDKSLRLILSGDESLSDQIQGQSVFDLPADIGDTVVWRRDGLVSYALACAVDDGQDVTEVVRGADLLDSTGVQLAIMRYLSLSPPRYAHIPVAIDVNDDKLSKHSKAPAISSLDPLNTLLDAWQFLGQDTMPVNSVDAFWATAFRYWEMAKVPAQARRHQ